MPQTSATQFRILYRGFLTRIIDLDVLSQHGDVGNAIARFASMLAAFSFLLSYGVVLPYMTRSLPPARQLYSLWNDEEFLLSTTIAVAGLLAVLAWNAFLPEKKDCLILGSLPIPLPVFAMAKFAALASAVGIAVVSINLFTGAFFPLAIAGNPRMVPAAFFGWFFCTAAAAAFVLFSVTAIQSLASQLLPWRAFLRVSALFQLVALAIVLFLFFASPAFAATVLESSWKLDYIPSYWFTGLLHLFVGGRTPALDHLAYIALRNLAIASTLATVGTFTSWRRNPRRIIESPEISPSRRRFLLPLIARAACRKPLDRAIYLFTARTIARSRQHRLLLAVYGGAGVALALTFLSTILQGVPSRYLHRPNMPFLTMGWLLLFAAIVGTRGLFVLPQDPRANWLFRVTQIESPHAYFAGVRRSLVLTGAMPMWVAAAAFYITVWPAASAAGAVALLLPTGMIFVYASLKEFEKVPFTCSWSPQSAQSRMKMMIWALVLTVFATLVSGAELWGISTKARFFAIALVLTAFAVHSRMRYLDSLNGDIEFESLSGLEMQTLDLTGDQHAPVMPVEPIQHSWLRPWHFAVVLLLAGLVYENVGQAHDHAMFPQIGHAFDIGGRKLNLSCLGTGSPTVVFEADSGQTGYSWVPFQRDIARSTRACWYDRAGYGWSDPGPFQQHSDRIARDLHSLLKAAGVPPPYVLVASEMSSFHARVFGGYYPAETAGLVLIDPMNEDMTINIHNHTEFLRPLVIGFYQSIGAFGGWRLFSDAPLRQQPGYTLAEFQIIAALNDQAKSIATQPKEKPLWINGELARAAGDVGSTPIIVLTSDQAGPVADEKLEDHVLTVQLNQRLAAKSSHGTWLSVHAHQNRIRLEAPKDILSAIHQLLQ